MTYASMNVIIEWWIVDMVTTYHALVLQETPSMSVECLPVQTHQDFIQDFRQGGQTQQLLSKGGQGL